MTFPQLIPNIDLQNLTELVLSIMRITDNGEFVNPTKRGIFTTLYTFSQQSPTRYTLPHISGIKTKALKKHAERIIAEDRPSGSAGDSATARLLSIVFSFGCAVACAWLGERSEPTCIKTSTRHGAKVIIFSLYRLFFLPNNLNFLEKRSIIYTLN